MRDNLSELLRDLVSLEWQHAHAEDRESHREQELLMYKVMRRGGLVLASIGLFAAGIAGGTALSLSAVPAVSADAPPRYPVNSDGLTVGSSADVASPAEEPDLILVIATNGHHGYVYKAALDRVDGTAAAESFTSPEDTIRWQAEQQLLTDADRTILVYEVDGKTVIGEFTVQSGSGSIVTG